MSPTATPRQQAAAVRVDGRVPARLAGVTAPTRPGPSSPTALPQRGRSQALAEGAGARSRGWEQRLRARGARGAGHTVRTDCCRC